MHATSTQRARYEFIHLLMKHAEITPATVTADNPKVITEGDIRWIAERLLYYGSTLGRIAENQCNGYQTHDYQWDEAAAKKDEAKEERIKARVEKLCAMIGCKPVFSGDPRGNVLKIQAPDGYTNDWGKGGHMRPN